MLGSLVGFGEGDLQAYFSTIQGKIGSKIVMWRQAGGES